jgi:hypothetical protein
MSVIFHVWNIGWILFSVFDPPCKDALSVDYIATTETIAIVHVGDDPYIFNDILEVQMRKVFKGEVRYSIVIDNTEGNFKFNTNADYLVYANIGDNRLYVVSRCSRTDVLENADDDLNYLIANIPCKVEPLNATGVCHRSSISICGCDGVTYYDDCEARKKGINIFSIGICKD